MNVLLIGNGGREAALAWKLSQSPMLKRLIVSGENPSWPSGTECMAVSGVDEIVALACDNHVDLVVVGPEAPLAAGLADALIAAGVPVFGPQRAAAELESSKVFAKDIMKKVGIPTAGALIVRLGDTASVEAGKQRIARGNVVIKADGLAAGKGVFVCPTAAEALVAFDEVTNGRFGSAAQTLLLEDLMTGPEVSIFALSDGNRVVALPSATDHKRLGDGDKGPNTGGMGAFAPTEIVPLARAQALVDQIHLPVIQELKRMGTPFVGVLFGGLMMTPDGPSVLEFNVRFGDPECQALMALWEDDLLPWLYGCATGCLPEGEPRFRDKKSVVVVLASAGYPETSTKGVVIPSPQPTEDVEVFFAGAKCVGDQYVTNGGRVLGVTAVGPDYKTARDRAYEVVEQVRFSGAQVRSDIAATVV